MLDIFDDFFRGKRVLVTGHTGFKGSWLCIWLHELGAEVVGVGLDPYSDKDNYVLSGIGKKIKADLRADIRDGEKMKQIFAKYQPEIVFHMAAQPLVRLSYDIPVETYQTNVMGTINIMEAIRHLDSLYHHTDIHRHSPSFTDFHRIIAIMITTDKCYDNCEQLKGYVETDPFGGYDPYSSSKGACEVAIQSWRRSFFNPMDYGKKHTVSLASVRAGNVIGGGDWAKDRIIPDCIRALEAGKPIEIRSPKAVRPWEHVLEPLSGYMLLAKKMYENPTEYCEGWNFGPEQDSVLTVWEVASAIVENYKRINDQREHSEQINAQLVDASTGDAPHEANLLMLNIDKAKSRLGWHPTLNATQCAALTADWYKRYQTANVYDLCVEEISQFISSPLNPKL